MASSFHFFCLTVCVIFNFNAAAASKPSSPVVQILAFGDSLTAGYRLDPKSAFPMLLENKLQSEFKDIKFSVTNAGVSGDTSGQGLRRVSWTLKKGPFQVVLLCLGANDGLRLKSLKEMESNLGKIIEEFRRGGVKDIVLIGMRLPTNFDPKYRSDFENVYVKVAKQYKVPLVPFLLQDVAAEDELNLSDGIHPNEKGHKLIADRLYPTVQKIVKNIN